MREHILKFAVALGGFLIFIGIIMVGVALILFNAENVVTALDAAKYRMLALGILFAIGVLDLVSGIILRRKWLR